MHTEYFKSYSQRLGRDMEMKVYGHSGRPFLFIPCQDGRFFDFENFNMAQTCAPWIENGDMMVFSIDTIDKETWSDKNAPAYDRIRRHEAWIRYIIDEAVPFIQTYAYKNGGWQGGVTTFGCSLGATHAANLFFRRPDLFNAVLALSGLYDPGSFFPNYMDETLYNNSPNLYLQNMPWNHHYIPMYNERKMVFCVGQGAWEDELKASTGRLKQVLQDKGIHAQVDFWGYDVNHDWDWWFKQCDHYVPQFI